MGKQHLSEFFDLISRKSVTRIHTFRLDRPRSYFWVPFFYFHRNESRKKFGNLMPACFCKSVSVSCRSCSRIRNPSSRYDHRICVNKMLLLFLGIIRNNDSCYFLVFYTYFFHFRTKRYLNAETVTNLFEAPRLYPTNDRKQERLCFLFQPSSSHRDFKKSITCSFVKL